MLKFGDVSDVVEIAEGVLRADDDWLLQAARSTLLGERWVDRGFPIRAIFRMMIWPDASSAQNSMGTVSASGRTVWALMRRRNSSFSRSIAFVVRADFH